MTITDTLTMDTIRAAQDKNLDASTLVVQAVESRISRLADRAAQGVSRSGYDYADAQDEFMQVGRVAAWDAIDRFKGGSVDDFYAFIHATVEGALRDAARAMRNPGGGVDKNAMKAFAAALSETAGDVYAAEKLVQGEDRSYRLSRDMAHAARTMWQGTLSTDAPLPVGEPALYADYGVPDDLITADDLNAADARERRAVVHSVLDTMGENQRVVLKFSFGIGGCTFYGHGDSGDDVGLAAEIGSTVAKVRDARTKGMRSFAKRYIAVAAKTLEEAQQLAAAAAQNLKPAGRK